MKTLQLQAIPSRRMRALTAEGAAQSREARINRIQTKWEDVDAPPPPDPLGGMIVVVITVLAAIFVGGFVLGAWIF